LRRKRKKMAAKRERKRKSQAGVAYKDFSTLGILRRKTIREEHREGRGESFFIVT